MIILRIRPLDNDSPFEAPHVFSPLFHRPIQRIDLDDFFASFVMTIALLQLHLIRETFHHNLAAQPSRIRTRSVEHSLRENGFYRDREDAVRSAYGIPEGEELYTGVVARDNDNRHKEALANNQDGGKYFKAAIEQHLVKLSPADKKAFKERIAESDPALFAPNELPKLVLEHALFLKDLPHCLRKYSEELEQLRKHRSNKKSFDAIATKISRDPDCIAALQKALQG